MARFDDSVVCWLLPFRGIVGAEWRVLTKKTNVFVTFVGKSGGVWGILCNFDPEYLIIGTYAFFR